MLTSFQTLNILDLLSLWSVATSPVVKSFKHTLTSTCYISKVFQKCWHENWYIISLINISDLVMLWCYRVDIYVYRNIFNARQKHSETVHVRNIQIQFTSVSPVCLIMHCSLRWTNVFLILPHINNSFKHLSAVLCFYVYNCSAAGSRMSVTTNSCILGEIQL